MATSWSATCPSSRSSTTARSTTSSRPSRAPPIYAAAERDAVGRRDRSRSRCSRCSPARTSRPGARSSSSTTRSSSRARRAVPSESDAAVLMLPGGAGIAVRIDGNGRRVAADPYRGHDRGGARVRGEPRVRRSRAARHDELPQLRQPREAAHRVAADRVRPRARRRLPRARRAGRRRQRLALQRGRVDGPIYPTPVVGMVGKLPDAARAGRLGFARRATRSPSPATSTPVARGLRAGEAARRAAARRPARVRPRQP